MSGAHSAEREGIVTSISLTIFFEDPFWVGVVEQQSEGRLRAARQQFGAEPSPGEVLEFVQRQMLRLIERSSVAVAVGTVLPRAINPKRAAREASRALAQRGSSTQSQEAIRLQLEQNKQIHRQRSKAERGAKASYKRAIKLAKAKARHRGR
jgi:hypothetical protein